MNSNRQTHTVAWLIHAAVLLIKKPVFQVFILAFLLQPGLFAQVGYDNNKIYKTGTSVSTLTESDFVVPAGNDRILIVNSSQNGLFATINSISYNGQALQSINSNGSFYIVELWYVNLGSGPEITSDIVVNLGATASEIVIGASSFNNVLQSNPFGNIVTTGGTPGLGHFSSQDVTTTNGDAAVDAIIILMNGNAVTLTGGNAQEEVYNMGFVDIKGGGSFELSTGATTTMSWSWTTPSSAALNFIHIGAQLHKASVLPVELNYFRGMEKESAVLLDWETKSESNNRGFEIQRGTDGISFEEIGWIDGNGNSFETHQYEFEDRSVEAGNTYYYRLAQLDFDEQVEFSNIVSINFKGNAISDFQVAPNPVKKESDAVLTFQAHESGIGQLNVYDTFGRLISKEEIFISTGLTEKIISTQDLQKGLYYVELNFGDNHKLQKLIISE